MTSIDIFRVESPIHRVREERNGFTIHPISQTKTDIVNFQNIAHKAALYTGTDYRVLSHPCDQGIDQVSFIANC